MMTCATPSFTIEYSMAAPTEAAAFSNAGTRFATLRTTKSSPGAAAVRSSGMTRESEQPM